jgi:phage gp46-like protein
MVGWLDPPLDAPPGSLPESTWDRGASVWNGASVSIWDSPSASIWDGGASVWDGGRSIWDLPASPLPQGGNGGDIRILWDNTNALGDWGLAQGDLETGQDLETACLVSLFSDVLATPDFTPTDGTTDRRGWWADPYNDESLGSNLWQLDRAKKTRATLGNARRYALDALNWLILDGVAKQIFVNTSWLSPTMLGIAVAIIKPDGSQTRFMFGWAWSGLAVVASPVRFVNPFPQLP